jgi:hypothetical protein
LLVDGHVGWPLRHGFGDGGGHFHFNDVVFFSAAPVTGCWAIANVGLKECFQAFDAKKLVAVGHHQQVKGQRNRPALFRAELRNHFTPPPKTIKLK